jgi:hypothetical protein
VYLTKNKSLQAAADGTSGRHGLVDVERPELTADGLPEDPAQEGDDKEEPHDDEAKAEPDAGEDAAAVTDEKKDVGVESPSFKGDNQEEKANGAGDAKEFEMTDEMKGRLLRFTLEEGELETIPTGRSLRDALPEDMGVMYVDQVCVDHLSPSNALLLAWGPLRLCMSSLRHGIK